MRKKIVAGNWKMNKTLREAMDFAVSFQERSDELPGDVEVIIAPPSLYLASMEMIKEPAYRLASQNCSHHSYGAFTGEISAAMLADMNVGYSLVGHSERRTYFHETDELLAKKLDACFLHGVVPVFCCGEHLAEREAKRHFVTVLHQLEHALFHLSPSQMSRVIIAYEPVWAIGTGVTASTEQAQEMHAFIRSSIAGHFGRETADAVRILYGGSVNASNSAELFGCDDVDGGLVGGASLKVGDFITIVQSASRG
jgi:triosephosphate isomerase (TIM)